MNILNPQFLRECFDYDPNTGKLYWRARPRSHFNSESAMARQHRIQAGKIATQEGESLKSGKKILIIKSFTHPYYGSRQDLPAGRVIWCLLGRTLSSYEEVLTRNGDGTDLRLSNLYAKHWRSKDETSAEAKKTVKAKSAKTTPKKPPRKKLDLEAFGFLTGQLPPAYSPKFLKEILKSCKPVKY